MTYRHSLIASLLYLLGGAACGSEDPIPPAPDSSTADVADVGDADDADVASDADDAADIGDSDVDADPDTETGDVADAEPDAPPTPIESFAWAGHNVFVHVTNDSPSVLPGATVFLDTRTAVTDENGDASFRDVGPGPHSLSVNTPGFVDGLWDIEIPHLNPLDIEIPHLVERRYFAALVPVGTSTGFDGDEDAGLLAGPMSVDLPAGALTGRGGPELGLIEAELTQSPGTLASGTSAINLDGDPETLEAVVSFDLTFLDENGVPLEVTEGSTLLARFDVDDAYAPGTIFPSYVLDELTGIWTEEPGSEGVVGADGFVEIEIPHLSRWAFGRRLPRDAGCTRVQIPGFADYPDATLRVDAESGSWALPVTEEVIDIPRLIPGEEVLLSLYIGGSRFRNRSTIAVAEEDGDRSTCAEQAEPVSLDSPLRASSGDGSATVRLHLRSGECPAQSVALRIDNEGGTYLSLSSTEVSTVVLDRVPEGTYGASATGPAGEDLGALEFVVDCSDCVREFRLEVRPGFASRTKGGCSDLRCFGDACDSCVAVDVRNVHDEPVSGSRVSAFEPLSEVYETDADGQFCVDVPGGADRSVQFAAHSFDATAVARLSRAASCESGGCAEVALIPSERINCVDGSLFDDALGVEFGHFDPRYSDFRDFDATPESSQSFFRATVIDESSGVLASALSEEPALLNQAVALNLVQQNEVGDEIVQGLSIRVVLPTSGLGFDVTLPPAAVRGGTFALADGAAFARLATLPQGTEDTSTYYPSTGGRARVFGIGGGRIGVDLAGTFASPEGDAAEFELFVIAPVLTEADSDQNLLAQRSHALNGRAVRILTADEPDGYVDTMTGVRSTALSPRGEFDLCVPISAFYMLRGEDVPGLLTPITSLYADTGDALTLFDNDNPDAGAFVTADLRWFDRDFMSLMYLGVEADPADIDTHGTITGRFADASGFLGQAGRVVLETGDGDIEAFLVGDDFRPTDTTAIYFFPSVPPTTLDAPYTLRAFRVDGLGDEILEFRQRVVPLAGTALIPHP